MEFKSRYASSAIWTVKSSERRCQITCFALNICEIFSMLWNIEFEAKVLFNFSRWDQDDQNRQNDLNQKSNPKECHSNFSESDAKYEQQKVAHHIEWISTSDYKAHWFWQTLFLHNLRVLDSELTFSTVLIKQYSSQPTFWLTHILHYKYWK